MSAIGHPCVGDTLYGGDPAFATTLGVERQWLQAKRLGFKHPTTGESVTYESEYAPDLAASLASLRAAS
jgi:23S rRNA pseudouridine1911/1915/1917 synthase